MLCLGRVEDLMKDAGCTKALLERGHRHCRLPTALWVDVSLA